jgi:hypothetical protein
LSDDFIAINDRLTMFARGLYENRMEGKRAR